MKKIKIWYNIVMFLPLTVTIISLFFLPDQIPMHYGSDNQVTRWGSKYEEFVLPALILGFGLFMRAMAKIASKDEKNGNNNNTKITMLSGFLALILFNVMQWYFLYTAFQQVTDLSEVAIDLYSLLFSITGVIFIVLGNYMPKAKMNSVVGLRIPWSMKNEEVWKKCQRFGGITFMLAGVILTVSSIFFLRGVGVLIWALVIFTFVIIADLIYARITAK